MATRKPSHPGEVLLKEFLQPKGIDPKDFAKHLGVSASTIKRLIAGKSALSVKNAFFFAKALGTTAEFWLNLQNAHALYYAKKDKTLAAELRGLKFLPQFKLAA